jgi:hypothetical protein
MKAGRADRKERLGARQGIPSASSSQDYVRLANLLFKASADEAQRIDGNCSSHALAGIPMLFAALRALLIEVNAGPPGSTRNDTALAQLDGPDLPVLFTHYEIPSDLRTNLELLHEVRNEIVHPTHIAGLTPHGTPAYLSVLRQSRLLQSTGNDQADYAWISQLKSHALFGFTFDNIETAARIILTKHQADEELREFQLESYACHRLNVDLDASPPG